MPVAYRFLFFSRSLLTVMNGFMGFILIKLTSHFLLEMRKIGMISLLQSRLEKYEMY